MTLDELLDAACGRLLTPEEQARLAEEATAEGAVQRAIGRLMSGGPTALLNLRQASALRQAQHTDRRTPEDFLAIKERDRITLNGLSGSTTMGFKVTFSHHAIERYIERCLSDGVVIPVEDASEKLSEEARHAKQLKAKTATGEEQWQCPSGAVLIIRRDGSGKPAFCTTVLNAPSGDMHPKSIESVARSRAKKPHSRWRQ